MPNDAIRPYIIIDRYIIPTLMMVACLAALYCRGLVLSDVNWLYMLGSFWVFLMAQTIMYQNFSKIWNNTIHIDRDTIIETVFIRSCMYGLITLVCLAVATPVFANGWSGVVIVLWPIWILAGYAWTQTNEQIRRILKTFNSARVK